MEHNLADYELTEVLEKALVSVKATIERPNRKFRQPFMERLAEETTQIFAETVQAINAKTKALINQ